MERSKRSKREGRWADLGPMLAVAGASLAVCMTVVASLPRVPLEKLGVIFDGHIYLEIAKSFPLPFPPESEMYVSHAPGYPAAIYLIRLALPDHFVNWGEAAALVTWLAAAASAVAFYALCRELSMRPLWPSLLFVVGNAIWIPIATAAHPEPLAMLFAVLALLAYTRDRVVWCMAFLSAAVLCRFPALILGLPLAFGFLVLRGRRDRRTLLALPLPLLALGVLHLYLTARIPGFTSIWEAHQAFWPKKLGFPFVSFIESAGSVRWMPGVPLRGPTYATLAFYLATFAIAWRVSERKLRVLPLWVGAVLLFQASLSGAVALKAFARLAILAWPAALLIAWRAVGDRLSDRATALLCVVLAAFGLWFAKQQILAMAYMQTMRFPAVIQSLERLDVDEPQWRHRPGELWRLRGGRRALPPEVRGAGRAPRKRAP